MTVQLTVPNMACSACGQTIAKAIKAIDCTAIIKTDPKTKLVSINAQVSEAAVKQAINDAGYSVA